MKISRRHALLTILCLALPLWWTLGDDAILGATQAHAAPVKYRYPLNVTSRWTTYRDNDSSGGIIDWNGGKYTYNGHEGSDFAQNKGTPIYAAADGTVEEVIDGKFDDCTTGACAAPSNRVRLKHSDGQVTYYLHMKKWSIVVKVGQKVKCGDKIGEVASSGRSTGNHLHFQVGPFRGSKEPFKGPKGATSSLWTSQGSYARSGSVPGTKCENAAPACTSNTDCKDAAKPVCFQGDCIPKPPAGCPFVKTARLGGLTLNVRSQTNTSSTVVGSVPEGACLPVQQTATGQDISGNTTWYKITYNGFTGWITAYYADCSSCGGVCADGQKQACYTGPSGTKGVGICKAGTQTCASGQWGSCSGQVKPAAKETCGNSKDDDCNGKTDDGCAPPAECQAGDTRDCDTGLKSTCGPGTQSCQSGKWGTCQSKNPPKVEECDNGKDDNCDGQIDEGCPPAGSCIDSDQDGFKAGSGCPTGTQLDCNDNDKNVHPNANEACDNNKDDNCNGQVDENCTPTQDCVDNDQDGFKAGSGCPAGQPVDCNDNDNTIHPNAQEICGNNIDEDCNGGDLPCKQNGENGCKNHQECASRLCFPNQGIHTCRQPCNAGVCPDGFDCIGGSACLPKQTNTPDGTNTPDASSNPNPDTPAFPEGNPTDQTLRIGCKNSQECASGRTCTNGICQPEDTLRPSGCGCQHTPPLAPPLTLLLLLALFWRKRTRSI